MFSPRKTIIEVIAIPSWRMSRNVVKICQIPDCPVWMQTKVFHLSRILVHHLVQTISDLEILFFSYRLTHRIAIPTFVSQLFARSKRKRKVHMEQQRTFFFLAGANRSGSTSSRRRRAAFPFTFSSCSSSLPGRRKCYYEQITKQLKSQFTRGCHFRNHRRKGYTRKSESW